MIGQVGKLDMRKAIEHWKAHGVDLSRILYQPELKPGIGIHHSEPQNHHLDKALDQVLIREAAAALESQTPVRLEHPIHNVNRTVGAMLSGEVARRYGHAGLPEDTISVHLTGTAGQSFGAFLAHGVSLYLTGDGNDYVGKGLSGGRVVVRQPPRASAIRAKTSSSATRCCTAPSPVRRISRASPASGSRCATPAPSRWWKAAAITAANT